MSVCTLLCDPFVDPSYYLTLCCVSSHFVLHIAICKLLQTTTNLVEVSLQCIAYPKLSNLDSVWSLFMSGDFVQIFF